MNDPRPHERRPHQWPSSTSSACAGRRGRRCAGSARLADRLEHLVVLLNQLATGIFADDNADDLASGVTMLKTTTKGIVEASIEASSWLGEIRFMSHLPALTIEEPDDHDEQATAKLNGDDGADPDDGR